MLWQKKNRNKHVKKTINKWRFELTYRRGK